VQGLIDLVQPAGIGSLIDVLVIAAFFYYLLAWFKRTKAAFVAFGMIVLAAVYVLARALNLVMTAYLFQGFFAVFLVALVVIFQEELRQFFERIAVWSFRRRGSSPLLPKQSDLNLRAHTASTAVSNAAIVLTFVPRTVRC